MPPLDSSSPPRLLRLPVVLLFVALHLLLFDRGLGGDGWASFAALESAVDDGDLHLENNLRGVVNGIVPTPTGHLVMQYPPGILLLDLPPFLAARAADALLPQGWLARGASLPPVGQVPRRVLLEVAAIVLARNLATLLGLGALALALRRLGWGERRVAGAVALTFLGGPLLFYSLVGMTHAPTFALAAFLFYLQVRAREAPEPGRLAFAAGAVLGFATLVRYGAVGLLPGALLALAGTSRARRLAPLVSCLLGFALPLLLLPFYWRASAGTWGPPGYGGDLHLTFATPWNVLFSPHHGLFLFHPALFLAALGLLLPAGSELRRQEPGIMPGMGTAALVSFLGVAVLHGAWSEWANPGGYGQRFLIDALPALGLGFAQILGGRPVRLYRPALLAATLFGYLLFFAAVTGLAPPPPPDPWPQRLSDYRPLLASPPGPARLASGLARASLPARLLFRGTSVEPPRVSP
jgi:hypothetical protein